MGPDVKWFSRRSAAELPAGRVVWIVARGVVCRELVVPEQFVEGAPVPAGRLRRLPATQAGGHALVAGGRWGRPVHVIFRRAHGLKIYAREFSKGMSAVGCNG